MGRLTPLSPAPHAALRAPLFRKYVAVFVLLLSATLVASGALEILFAYQEHHAALAAIQQEKVSSVASRIQVFIDQIQLQLEGAVAISPLTPSLPVAERRGDYVLLLRRVPAITVVGYLDRDGREQLRISRVAPDVVGSRMDYRNSSIFEDPHHGLRYFSPVYFREESEPYITISVADPAGGGVSYDDVNLKFIWDVVGRLSIGEAGYAYVVDAGGELVAHPDISLVLKRTSLRQLPHVESALAARQPLATVGRNLQHELVLSASQAIASPDWTVFVEQPLAEAYVPLYSSLIRTALLLITGLGLSVIASLVLARRMVRPIRALQEGAVRLGSGDLGQHIEVTTGDELEALADAFNRMSLSLRDAYVTLEDKVQQRTSALEAALQSLEDKRQELERASGHKSEFLANMSHELRTPLNAIIGYTEILVAGMVGDVNERQREFLRGTLSSGRHLLSLIDDVLDMAKIEAGRMELSLTSFALVAVLENALGLLAERATWKGVSLALVVDSDLSMVEADERKIKQILFNLVANAIKFTPAGGRVAVTARRISAGVEIAVADTGIGILPSDQERIFEKFQQIRNPRLLHEGAGLGLALVKRFVELHDGSISVSSEVGRGTTFLFTLPCRGTKSVTGDPSAVGTSR